MKKIYDGSIFADYNQFWLHDCALDDDEFIDSLETLADNAVAVSRRLRRGIGFAQVERLSVIGTDSHSQQNWLEIFASDQIPHFRQRHGIRLVIPLTTRRRTVRISTPTEARPQISFRIPSGDYRLYVFGYHLGVDPTAAEQERFRIGRAPIKKNFEGYRLVFVPRRSPVRKKK